MLFFFSPILVAIIATVIWSRFKIKRGKKPSAWLAVFSAFGASILFCLIVTFVEAGSRALHFEYWRGDGKFNGLEAIAPIGGIFAAISLIPSYLAILIHQRRYNRDQQLAEQDAAANP